MVPRSGRVDGGVDHVRAALALGEPRAATIRSGWAGATQRGRGERGESGAQKGWARWFPTVLYSTVLYKKGGDDEIM